MPVRGICACFHIINNTVSLRRSISSFERLHPDCTVPRIVPLCHANQGVCQACTHQGGVQEPIRVHIVWRGVGGWGGCTNQQARLVVVCKTRGAGTASGAYLQGTQWNPGMAEVAPWAGEAPPRAAARDQGRVPPVPVDRWQSCRACPLRCSLSLSLFLPFVTLFGHSCGVRLPSGLLPVNVEAVPVA